jgi:hypothetical protein
VSVTQTKPRRASKRRSEGAGATARRGEKKGSVGSLLDNAASAGATARIVTFERAGLFAIEVSRVPAPPRSAPDGVVRLIWLACLPSETGQTPEIVGNSGQSEKWLGQAGGTIALQTEAGGRIMGVVFGPMSDPSPPPDMIVLPLSMSGAREQFEAAAVAARSPGPQLHSGENVGRIPIRVVAHIERVGDVLYREPGRIGQPDPVRRIEGFAIDPLQDIPPHDLQYRAVFRGGIEGPWITGPHFCGTRGRGEPLFGFAIRLAPYLQERFSVAYRAGFSESGASRPCANGESCQMTNGEYLVTMNIEIFENPKSSPQTSSGIKN